MNTVCNVCSELVLEEDSICCSFCWTWIHLNCSGLSYDEFEIYRQNDNLKWQCPKCFTEELPFSNLDNKQFKKLFNQNHVSKKVKFLNNLNYKSHCTVCDRKNHLRNKAIPCQICISYIHQKCSNLDRKYLNNMEYRDLLNNWQCSTCTVKFFPLASLDDESFLISLEILKN